MMTHDVVRFAFASLLPLSIAACSGAPATDLNGPAASAAPTPSAPVQLDGGPAPTADAAPPAVDGSALPPIATHCTNASTSSTDLCIENAQGHAGDIVDVDVYFLGSTTCTDAYEANGHIVADAASFQLANPVQQVACISRSYYGAPAPGTIEIMWNAFGGGAIQGCPNNIVPGKLDTVKIQILPGTPPGDYPITWTDGGIAGTTQQCAMFGAGVGIAGTIRVLP
jgi:hypothetical protein